jgi:small redox-active disulfide protein 2
VKIQILGMGCPKCRKAFENAERAVKELGICADLEKVEDLNVIIGLGVMVTPAIAIDGEVRLAGKVPSVEELKTLIAGTS